VVAAIVVAGLLGAGAPGRASAAGADDGPGPPRPPSVAAPADLSEPGWIELETALMHERGGGGMRRDGWPVKLKLAFSPDLGVELGVDGWVRQRDGSGARTRGFGDTSLVVKSRFVLDEAQALGLEAGANLPTARHGLGSGSGKTDWTVNGIYSLHWHDWHVDLNAGAVRLRAVEAGAGRAELLWAAALWRGWGEGWGVVAELSGARRRGPGSERQVLLAVSRSVSPRLVLDVGAARSLGSGAHQWSAFAGFTWLAGRVF
jgi:hypothetical protein